ncbi:hypothetical protein IMCC3317_29730 [Kordia antarctica]|uniref:Uncharacterized protein n=1 Tax=Kordia antarctica TaxID=1218801 RepID=A0A7L4ZLL3_9FLAO|nr:hypothetical protein IMCC3317_29730 [Kordia antarctica]
MGLFELLTFRQAQCTTIENVKNESCYETNQSAMSGAEIQHLSASASFSTRDDKQTKNIRAFVAKRDCFKALLDTNLLYKFTRSDVL